MLLIYPSVSPHSPPMSRSKKRLHMVSTGQWLVRVKLKVILE